MRQLGKIGGFGQFHHSRIQFLQSCSVFLIARFLGDSTKLKICYTLLETSYIAYRMDFYGNFESSSCQIWKLPMLQVDKFESCQNWTHIAKIEYILPKLQFDKIENCYVVKLLSCLVIKLQSF